MRNGLREPHVEQSIHTGMWKDHSTKKQANRECREYHNKGRYLFNVRRMPLTENITSDWAKEFAQGCKGERVQRCLGAVYWFGDVNGT